MRQVTPIVVVGALWMALAAVPVSGCVPGPAPRTTPGASAPETSDDDARTAALPPAAVTPPPPADSGPIVPATRTSTTRLLTAARALDGGRPADALAALALDARLTSAEAAESGGSRAAPTSGVTQGPPASGHPARARALDPLAAYRALLTAEAQLAQGDVAAARVALERATAPAIHVEAERLRARAIAADPAAAARALLGLPPTPADLAAVAQLLDAAQRSADARAAEDTLLARFPESPQAQAIAAPLTIDALHARLGSSTMERIERLLDTHQNERARDEARAHVDDPKLGCRARYVEGKALRKLRHYRAALEALPRAVTACADDERHARAAQLLEIQVRAIRGETKGVRAATEALLHADADHRFGDDALLLLAQVEERDGDAAGARKTYQRILADFPTGDQAGAAAWGLAFEAIQRAAWAEAAPNLETAIAASWVDPVDRARARYWLARAHEAQKQADTCARYREAALADGLGFFTWLTLSRLDAHDAPCAKLLRDTLTAARATEPNATAQPTTRPTFTSTPAYARARALFAQVPADARDPAAERLRSWARAELRTIAAAPTERVALALAFDAAGAHKDAQDILRARDTGVLDHVPAPDTLEAWRAAYSRAFADEVGAAAQAESIDPLLLTALAREESTFDPEIVSWAGAVGLAQLMPGTAHIAHLAVTKKKLDLDRLTEPALNLRLGAYVLNDGLRKFDQLTPLALGAYNGGPGLVRKALPRTTTDFDLWCETISVRETRRYIQRVMGTWGIYHYLYGEGRERFIPLPATVPGRP